MIKVACEQLPFSKEAVSLETLAQAAKKLKYKIFPAGAGVEGTAQAFNTNIVNRMIRGAGNKVPALFKKYKGGFIVKNRGLSRQADRMSKQLTKPGQVLTHDKNNDIVQTVAKYKGNLSSVDHHALNNITNLHEHFETQVLHPNQIESHWDPNVILKERNITKTLPPEARNVKGYFEGIRKSEFAGLEKATKIPISRVGEQRLSRHAIKRISQKYMKVTNPEQLKAIQRGKADRTLQYGKKSAPFAPRGIAFKEGPAIQKGKRLPSANPVKAYRSKFKDKAWRHADPMEASKDLKLMRTQGPTNPNELKRTYPKGYSIYRRHLQKKVNLPV